MKKNLLYAGCFFLLIAACRPAKKVQRIEVAISKKDTAQTVVIKPEKEEETVDSFSIVKNIVNNLYRQRIDFTTFYGKVKIEYEGKEGGDQATASIRMRKDSLIWVSLTGALGIEGFRMLINKDSVKLMNKLNKTIQYRSISYLQELTQVPVDFYDLQDFIVGNPVFLDSNIVSYKAAQNELLVLIVGKIFKNLLTLENKNFKIIHSKLDDLDPNRNRTCDITLSGYANANNISFSTDRKISISEKSKLDVNLLFKQYSFNQPQTFPFNIPKNYKKK
jgi:hypothetical protein